MIDIELATADAMTEKQLNKMEKHITKVYRDAYRDVDKSWKQYIKGWDEVVDGEKVHHKGLNERYKEEYQAYLDGKYTKEQFDAWYLAQVGRGKRWEALRDEMARRMTEANQIMAAYINDKTPGIYSLNANFVGYQIEKNTGIDFTLINEQAVRNLMFNKNFTEFRTLSVNPIRDYNWNYDKIQKALLSGILQGNSVEGITKKFMEVMGSNEAAARRNARTAVTGAQNGGRQATFNRAVNMGIDLQKEWISTHDGKVRDSHAELDGVRVGNDKPFPNGCMFPGDPAGHPGEVYNCRCTMRAILPKYNGAPRTDKTTATYSAWVFEKEEKRLAIADDAKQINNLKYIDDVSDYWAKAKNIDQVKLGETILNDIGLKNVIVETHTDSRMGMGYCEAVNKNGILEVKKYSLLKKDKRTEPYKVKTAYHESYHARGNGYKTDMPGKSVRWSKIEETFAETSAHYNMSLLGHKDLAWSYPDYIFEVAPKLVQTQEYSNCKTLLDIGKKAYSDRLSGKGSVWLPLETELSSIDVNPYEFSKKYLENIEGNIEGYVDKVLENMPQYSKYKNMLTSDLQSAIIKIKNSNYSLNNNESIVFKSSIVTAMERMGL